MGMGGEWELKERNDSRKHSRSYPQESWGRTPLAFSRSFEVANRWHFPFRENSMFRLHVRSSTNFHSWY